MRGVYTRPGAAAINVAVKTLRKDTINSGRTSLPTSPVCRVPHCGGAGQADRVPFLAMRRRSMHVSMLLSADDAVTFILPPLILLLVELLLLLLLLLLPDSPHFGPSPIRRRWNAVQSKNSFARPTLCTI